MIPRVTRTLWSRARRSTSTQVGRSTTVVGRQRLEGDVLVDQAVDQARIAVVFAPTPTGAWSNSAMARAAANLAIIAAGPRRASVLRTLEQEEGNVLAAMRWCVEAGDAVLGLRLGGSGSRYWFIQGTRDDCRNWRTMLEQLLDRGGGDPRTRADALNGAGMLYYDDGDYDSAKKLHTEALAIGRQLNEPTLIASSLHYLGRVAIRLGDNESAFQLMEEALAIQRTVDDRPRQSVGLNVLAGLAAKQGDYAAARRLHAGAAAVCQELDDATGVAEALSRQGFASLMLGDLPAAREASTGRVGFSITAEVRRLEIRVGPLMDGSAAALEADAQMREAGSALLMLSDTVQSHPVDGAELLSVIMSDKQSRLVGYG